MPESLTATQVAAIAKDGTHRVDRNLYLQVRGERRSWLLRYKRNGKTHWMGLGRLDDWSLTDAKRRAGKQRRLLDEGIDPIQAKRADAAREGMLTFEQATDRYIAAHKDSWSSAKHGENWRAQLKRHAYPVIGKLALDQIDANHIVKLLEPIWFAMPTTAGKIRGRVERVMDWATNAGFRTGPNPAAWRGGLEHRMPALSSFQKVEGRVAVPWQDAPKVYQKLKEGRARPSSQALLLIILTGVRSESGRGAHKDEFDLEAKVWTVPASRMKGTKARRAPFRVPLSNEAIELVRPLVERAGKSGYLFPGNVPGGFVTDPPVRERLREVAPLADVHGWRSTLSTWATDKGWPLELADASIQHAVGSKVARTYMRSDLLERRAPLLDAWAKYLISPLATYRPSHVVAIE